MSAQPDGGVIPEVTFDMRLRIARRHADLGQRELAGRIGVSPTTYSAWEAGSARPRDIVTTAKKIGLATHVSVAWLLGLDPSGDGSTVRARRDSNPQPSDPKVPAHVLELRRHARGAARSASLRIPRTRDRYFDRLPYVVDLHRSVA